MRSRQKQIFTEIAKDEPEILRKVGEIFYLSGNVVCEGKTLRQTMASVSKRFPSYLSFDYDARFFGLLSSKMEAVFSMMAEKGYTEQMYNVKRGQPVHLARRLSDEYQRKIQKDIEDGSLKPDMIKDLAAEVLSVTSVPLKVSAAWGLYLAYIDKEKPDEKNVGADRAPPIDIKGSISEASVDKLVGQLKEEYKWMIENLEVKRSGGTYNFYFSVKKSGIRDRYQYLVTTDDYLKRVRNEFKNAKGKEALRLLLINAKGEFPELEREREIFLQKLVEHYGLDLADRYVEATLQKLDKIEERPREIDYSYHRILDHLLGTLADASEKYPEPEKKLRVSVSVVPKIPFVRSAITSCQLYVPDHIREEVSKVAANGKWHFGVDWHVLHIPQILERLYLIEQGFPQRVSSSLLQRTNPSY